MSTLLIGFVFLLMFPFITYVTVKVGTYAFFKGRESFFNNQNGRRDDGEK